MRARCLSALFLLASFFSLPGQVHASEPRLEGSAISASGVHTTLYVASPESNRQRDVLIRFETPIYPRSVQITLGQLVSHDDGRESYLEISTSLPYAYQRDADEATCELFVASDNRMFTPVHQVTLKVVFVRQAEGKKGMCGEPDSVTFTLPGMLDGFSTPALDGNN